MKIMLIEPGGYGATFQYAHNLADALAVRRHQICLATGVGFETRDYPRHYQVLECFDRYIPRPIRLGRLLGKVVFQRPQIIHIQGHLHPGTYLAIWSLLKRLCSAKLIYTAQDVIPKMLKRHHMWALTKLYPQASHIFVNARQNRQMLMEKFAGISPERISVIPLADLTAFVKGAPAKGAWDLLPDRKVVLFFGNIEPRKGLMPLIQAFARVCCKLPEAYLMVVGKVFFEDVSVYQSEIERLGISDRVRLHAEYIPLDEIPSLFAQADLFAAPYLKAWNSGAIATALAYGKPVIASDIGGNREVIENGKSGLLVAPGNVPALAEALIRTLSDDALRAQMAQGARAQAEKNGWPEIARKTEAVYRSVLGL